MAKSKYIAGPKFTTPRAPAIWPRLNEPDTKHDAAGVYECKQELQLDDPVVQKIKAKAMELAQAKFAEIKEQFEGDSKVFFDEDEYEAKVSELKAAGKKALAEKLKLITLVEPLAPEIDDEGDETGTCMLKCKMKASGVYKTGPKTGQRWERKPNIFNAKGKQLASPPKIGGGSDVKMSIELSPYYAANDGKVGVTFRMEAIQLITLVQFGQRDAAGYGFGAEDGDDIGDDDNTSGGFSNESGSGDEDDEL
ncbi:hypothetical protein [Novosphingobium lindaniclasticum]|uniref:Single-stranded DNA-binding protein BPT7 domain-containing protein n=1 Tax=Novosphingobium lindaniclasticum LE124 TaxID=1096930 RepID=T0IFE0_9SPHN|nr:hypothetical protein [Novosphingobium lindaniclasticum]EQB10395.1 hypothetical protein L284_17015 [Novosphingobium lindaniclasticum LE124]